MINFLLKIIKIVMTICLLLSVILACIACCMYVTYHACCMCRSNARAASFCSICLPMLRYYYIYIRCGHPCERRRQTMDHMLANEVTYSPMAM